MNKGQGFLASSIVVAGALLRPASTGQPPPVKAPVKAGAPISSTMEATLTHGDGPWRASCNYWQPGHWTNPTAVKAAREPSGAGKSAAGKSDTVKAREDSDAVNGSKVKGSLGEALAKCGKDGWGITPAPGTSPRITAILATVPDPVHSSLSLEFDRSIDVLTQAAAVNGFVGSYFWLPWRQPDAAAKEDGQTHHEETGEDLQREKQPGLLILKRADAVDRFATRKKATDAYPADDRVIYLFLVGQTPALGVNGDQMQEALRNEAYLAEQYGARLSLREEHEADVIGPTNSGSARSLRLGLDSAQLPGITKISVAGNTETKLATDVLNSKTLAGPRQVSYISFGDDTQFEQTRLLDLFSAAHPDGSRIAFLLENGTVFGAGTAKEITKRADSEWHARNNQRKKEKTAAITAATAGQPAEAMGKEESGAIASPLVINFPREISLLRNAQSTQKAAAASDAASGAEADSQYLHLSLVDPGVEDTVPHFSQETPTSQEAQLMAIGRELRGRHIEVVAISASNILDELFLAKFLRREVPDARQVFFGSSDLMFVRVGDNTPYMGSVTLTAYPFTVLSRSGTQQHLYNFANAWTEALYNAASYTFWDGQDLGKLWLTDYRLTTDKNGALTVVSPFLWAAAAGRDGYYPLGTVNPCASDSPAILPTFGLEQLPAATIQGKAPALPAKRLVTTTCGNDNLASPWQARDAFDADRPEFPALSWYVLCLVLSGLCVAHCVGLYTANFWSPATRDLDLKHGDQPRRRVVFLHIATTMLWSMCVITTVPLFLTISLMHFNMTSGVFAGVTLGLGLAAVVLTLIKTLPHARGIARNEALLQSGCASSPTTFEVTNHEAETRFYPLFNGIALLAAIGVPVFWLHLDWPGSHNYVGLFFGFRCLHPLSAVSPLPPILLLLVAWYLWAYTQTRRLRFSENSRPMLPKELGLTPVPLYVSDDSLRTHSLPTASCLYENLTCLFITRQMMRRVIPGHVIGYGLVTAYIGLFLLFVLGLPIHSLDHFLRHAWLGVTWYEILMGTLFYPLLVIALTGAVRMWVVWGSLRRGVLQPLERSPLRFAFSRLTNAAWTAMLKQGGLIEYWRDMNRSTEAVQQMSHTVWAAEVPGSTVADQWHQIVGFKTMAAAHASLRAHQQALISRISGAGAKTSWDACGNFLSGRDLPEPESRHELNLMCAVECDFSQFAEGLLASVLVPYWRNVRDTPVEANALPSDSSGDGDKESAADGVVSRRKEDPPCIQLAEEFLAIRYVSLIRGVLINLRQLMLFVSSAFVLATIAWSCYPFEPRQWIDYAFTGLLGILGVTVSMVLMQLHRDPIMSRITGTAANELGGSFYLRLLGFGAVPLLTWLASQFPGIGGNLSKLVQSGMEFAK